MSRRFIITLSAFTAFLFFTSLYLDSYISNWFKTQLNHKSVWVFDLDHDTVDYVVVGSSRAFNMLHCQTVFDSCGWEGLNLGTSGGGIAEQYLLFSRYVSKNKTCCLLLQVDYSTLNSSKFTYPFHEYYFFPFFSDIGVDSVIKDNSSTLHYWMWKFLPLSKYSEFNSEFIRFYFNEPKKSFDSFGSAYIDTVFKARNNLNSFENNTVVKPNNDKYNIRTKDNKSILYLNSFMSICKEKNIKIILYTAPEFQDTTDSFEPIRKEIIYFYDSLAHANNAKYIHFYKNDWSFLKSNFTSDMVHLHHSKIKEFSKQMGDSISNMLR